MAYNFRQNSSAGFGIVLFILFGVLIVDFYIEVLILLTSLLNSLLYILHYNIVVQSIQHRILLNSTCNFITCVKIDIKFD